MKTKEIEVWVDQAVLVHVKLYPSYEMATSKEQAEQYECPMIKARLIIEIPEQKVEITESQAEAVWNKHRYNSHVDDFKKALGFTVGDE